MIGATDAGYKAHLINVLLNVKTEEKGLQFEVANFKTMFVGENTKKALESKLTVDKWKVTHSEVSYIEENDLEEEYVGQVVIDQTKEKQERMTFHRGGNLKSIMNCTIRETLENGINIFFNLIFF